MLSLFRPVLLLICIAAITLLAPRMIGGARSTSVLTSVMSEPDGGACDHLCLFGVVPGETNIEKATSMLHSHPLTRDSVWSDDHTLKLPGPDAYIAFSLTDDGLVDSIIFADNLHNSGKAVPESLVDTILLGDVIETFGVPAVSLNSRGYFFLTYPAVGMLAASARPLDYRVHVLARTRLSVIMIYVIRPCPKGGLFEFLVHPWMGFAVLKRYWTDHRQYEVLHRSSGVSFPSYVTCQK